MSERSTIRDVAERAGCSISTVSRVLNGVGRSSAETRARVQEAAAALDFRFDQIGQSLKNRRTRTLGALVPTLSNPVFADAIGGLQQAARAAGYQLLLSCANYDAEQEAEAVATLLAHRVDGLALTVSDAAESPALETVRAAGAPFVLLFNQPEAALPAVAVDNRAAAAMVAARLRALGHRDCAFVAGRFLSSDRSKQRYLGFREAMRAAGAPEPALVEVDYEGRSHLDALAAMLAERPGLTALFCSNDMLALTVIGGLRSLGRAVPRDLSVVGFDGTHVAALGHPSLATVATPCAEMGRAAAERLIARIETDTEPAGPLCLLPFEFRPGTSLGPVRDGMAGAEDAASAPAHAPATLQPENET